MLYGGRITDHHAGFYILQNQPDPVLRHLHVNRDIIITAGDHTVKSSDRLRTFLHKDNHRLPVNAFLMEKCPHSQTLFINFQER